MDQVLPLWCEQVKQFGKRCSDDLDSTDVTDANAMRSYGRVRILKTHQHERESQRSIPPVVGPVSCGYLGFI
ncbi:MAG TPA: hypothetical protein VI758_11600 [Bacteroidota bacterium]